MGALSLSIYQHFVHTCLQANRVLTPTRFGVRLSVGVKKVISLNKMCINSWLIKSDVKHDARSSNV